MRMFQHGRGFRFTVEPLHLRGRSELAGPDHFQGHGPIQADLPGTIHDSHATVSDFFEKLIVVEALWQKNI